MKRKTRLLIAAIVTLIVAITATSVWAASSNKEGSLGRKIHHLTGSCNGGEINMGDATFVMTVDETVICTFDVTRTKVPNAEMGGAPNGMEYRSDGFIVTGGPANGIGVLEVCFAYSPQDAEKHAGIYVSFGHESAMLPSVKTGSPSQLCTTTGIINGTFAMVGDAEKK